MEAAPPRHAYSSDQTDELWAILESLIPAPAEDAPYQSERTGNVPAEGQKLSDEEGIGA